MITVQGDYGEGGGAIVRLSVALSAFTGKPVKITNIRAKRCSPGLREQHKRGVLAVAELCNAETKNVEVGSTEIEFIPGKIGKNAVHVNIGTAGSVGLVLQALLLPCFKADKEVRISIKGGGTLGLWSPNVLYTKHVLFPMIEKMGFKAEMDVKRHGFFPRGGAEVSVKTFPCKNPEKLELAERGSLLKVKGIALSSSSLSKRKVSERMKKSAKALLGKKLSCPIKIDVEYVDAYDSGCGILLMAEHENCIIAWDALGALGKRAEDVGKEAAEGILLQLSGPGTVDDYMSDQLLPYLATAGGSFCFNNLTDHAKTNMWLIEKFLPVKFSVEGNKISAKKDTQKL